MAKPKLRKETAAILLERDIALWDAHHYTDQHSAHQGRPTSKDPVSVCLATPRALDRYFYGRGPDVDAAVMHALASNSGLNYMEPGVTGALARLENELHALNSAMWQDREKIWVAGGGDELDFDIPF